MKIAIIDPHEIRLGDGQMKAVWKVPSVSQSPRRQGQVFLNEDSAFIPDVYAPIIEQAKLRNKKIRISYEPVLGIQTVSNIELL